MDILRRNGAYALVQPPAGIPPIEGWIQTAALGLRVLRTTNVWSRPGGKPIGRIRGGLLVRTLRKSGAFTQIEVDGKTHARMWIRTKDLGTQRAENRSSLRYVSGPRRILKPGPVFTAPGGGSRVVSVLYPAEVRIRGTKKRGGTTWTHIAIGMPWYVHISGWVPNRRLTFGFAPVMFGTNYQPNPPSRPRAAGFFLLQPLDAFAANDDAYATVRLPAGSALDVRPSPTPGWVRLVLQGPGLRCNLSAPDRPGLWTRKQTTRTSPIR